MFDVVVPVYNAMHHVRACLNALARHSTAPFRLIAVNDASGAYATAALRSLIDAWPGTPPVLIEHAENRGYLASVNEGVQAGANPFVICMNSDTAAPPGHLERMRAAFEADPRIGVVNPVSNWANWTRVCWQFPEGHNMLSVARRTAALSDGVPRDLGNASGFYFAVRRAVFEQIGMFDEAYGRGYYEDADFCMRALDAGWRVVVDDGAFVYHHGWGSFQEHGRNAEMIRNERLFLKRWRKPYEAAERQWRAKPPIGWLEPRFFRDRNHVPRVFRHAARPALSPRQARDRIDALMRPGADPHAAFPAEEPVRSGADRVIYILPALQLYGGVISVLQVVNELVLRGLDAHVATYGEVDEAVYDLFPMYFRAQRFPDMAAMVAGFPECDAVVATQWETAYPAAALKQLRPHLRLAYYVQDFEPDFYRPGRPDLAALAEHSYRLIRHQIVKTRWLRSLLRDYGGVIHRIPLGLNLDFYHDHGARGGPQVLALARPASARRNFPMLEAVYAALHARRPGVTLAFYGQGYEHAPLPFPVRSYGKLTQAAQVAQALNESTILLDCSTFQGFGRPGLEAMACGTAAVLTDEGGITQYAKHEHNCLLVNAADCDDIVGKVLALLDDADKRRRLVAQGLETARAYSLDREGARTAALMTQLLEGRDPEPVEPDEQR